MNHLSMLSFLPMVFILLLCLVLLIITSAFYPSLLVDEVDDTIGVDDTVERVDDDLNFPPSNPVIQAPIVPPLIDQTNSPTLSLDTSSKAGDYPKSFNTSLVGGNEFFRYSFPLPSSKPRCHFRGSCWHHLLCCQGISEWNKSTKVPYHFPASAPLLSSRSV